MKYILLFLTVFGFLSSTIASDKKLEKANKFAEIAQKEFNLKDNVKEQILSEHLTFLNEIEKIDEAVKNGEIGKEKAEQKKKELEKQFDKKMQDIKGVSPALYKVFKRKAS
ncbi:hypothetical protein [Flammeovirga sp. SubArs3]|uniref:hypothetical protein n=1 Tax=Flammeovirga sp. SubArs3 TaxID=2995316 RepID=UPI00248C05EA|nr:hypothetical protein [Flammeovirga sp. SubArs3]